MAYKGSAKVTQIYSKVNATNFVLVYRCESCLLFDDPSQPPFNTSTSVGSFEQGWAQSTQPPTDRTNPDSPIRFHNNGMGVFQIMVPSAVQPAYATWAALAGGGPSTTTTVTVTGTPTPTAAPTFSAIPVPTSTTYDYVVVGGGAAGIPIADRLSEAGHSVLLIEKGVASSARWGGSKPNLFLFEILSNRLSSLSPREWLVGWV